MFTERRLVQWPHLTVTTSVKLVHGTFTYIVSLRSVRNNVPANTDQKFQLLKSPNLEFANRIAERNLLVYIPIEWWCNNHIEHSKFDLEDHQRDC